MFSGEVMPVKQLNKLKTYYPDALYVNLYGPTEITCNCTYYILDRDFSAEEKLPIGIPFENEHVFLLDENNQEAKDGSVGEICASGTPLALGYYNNEEMTEKNFVQNPLNKAYPETIYRTGDLGYYKDGLLYFSGRKDFQIKHMGHRIELGEIESVAGGLPEIDRCCCLYNAAKRKIILFCSLSENSVLTGQQIRSILREKLSTYMLPGKVIVMEQLPINQNGKIDRQKLKAML